MTMSTVVVGATSARHNPPVRRRLTLGIDVGGTNTTSVVTDADELLLLRESEPTQRGQLAGQLTAIARRALDTFGDGGAGTIEAIGIAVPGHVETRTGTVGLAVNLGGAHIALGPLITHEVGVPCYLEHDARAAATWLHQPGGPDMAYLSIGTGISAGIVLDNRVLRGANGLAGEVGHIVADPAGPECPCGLRGCAESAAAGPAIARLAREKTAGSASSSLEADATAADVFRAARTGDAVAAQVVAATAEHIARSIRGLVLTLGLERVIIGGGVAAAGDLLLDQINSALARERAASPLVESAFAKTTIEILEPTVEAGARGAAAIARRRFEAEQREGVGDR